MLAHVGASHVQEWGGVLDVLPDYTAVLQERAKAKTMARTHVRCCEIWPDTFHQNIIICVLMPLTCFHSPGKHLQHWWIHHGIANLAVCFHPCSFDSLQNFSQ